LITGTGGSDSLAYVRMGGTVDSAVREIWCQYVGEAGHKNLMDTTGSRRSDFEQLYEEYRLPVLAYCTRRVRASDAPDACSETFLVAWRRLDDLPAEPKTLPYLYGIAGKVVSNQLRSFRRRGRLDGKLKGLGVEAAPDPSTVVVRRALDGEVESAVRQLRPKDREIVMLYAWEDLSRETIADMMGMSKPAVDQRIHRAYQRLARALDHVADTQSIRSPLIAEEGGT
jgi:RNA polymerase sigma-70 factor (ECF subfamily)